MPQLSPLSLSALGLLREGPMHPYEVYRLMLERRHDRVVKLRLGTLYHAIGRLAEAELIEVVGTDRDGHRPERTTYRLTAAGQTLLTTAVSELTATPVYEYPSFPVALSELHSLPQARATEVLSARAEVLRAELDLQRRTIARLQHRRVPTPYWLEVDYQHATLAAEESWVTSLLVDLQSGRVDWDDRTPPFPPDGDDAALMTATTPLYPDLPARKVS